MALSLDSLTAYIEENKSALIMKPIDGSRTFDYVDVRQNIKSGDKIPILESTAPAQSGASCGFTSSGTTTISQTTLDTVSIKVQEAICLNDLEEYFTQKYLPSGANPETTSIEEEIWNRKLAKIAQKVGQMLWQGKTTYTNDTYLKQLNGWISLIDTNSATTIAATQQASISTSTVRGIHEDIIFSKLPTSIADEEIIVYEGMDTFRTLQLKLMQDNLFHINNTAGTEYKNNEMIYPGSNIKVVGIPELNASNSVDSGGSLATAVKNRIIAGAKSNFVVGFDLKKDMSDFKVWYSQDNMDLRFSCRFRIGVTNHFYDQIVQYTNT